MPGKKTPNGRRFIQFPHPGEEHQPDRPGSKNKSWNPVSRPHARKFMELEGTWLRGSRVERGKMWAWGEWEPESRLSRLLDPITDQYPRFLWKPYWVRKPKYHGLHNTDPFIYDGFYYTDCKQARSPGLRHLDTGSIIVFGSARNSSWVLDTVFVVQEYIDHDHRSYTELPAWMLPYCYGDVTLEPTYQASDKQRTSKRRLYIGATHSNPIWGMYSFFPCMPEGIGTGFPRPSITLCPVYFNEKLKQGTRGQGVTSGSLAVEVLRSLWTSIVRQVQQQGLQIGVAARSPRESLAAPEE